jgi:tetratricopeptide (TPR) repeat protein
MAGAILATTLIVYAPALRAGFIFDDDAFLTENRLIHAEDGLARFWTTADSADYFPLTLSMLWFEWRIWGTNPAGYHLINVLLHAASSILLWRVLAALKIQGAWLAGLIFAVHPVNVESVAWITQRKNALSMVFYLLTFLFYIRFERTRSPRWYCAALGTFLLGLLSKTSIVMLPLVLLALAWWRFGRISRRDVSRIAPFLMLSLVLGLVTLWYQTLRPAVATETVRTDDFLTRLAAAGWAIWFYLSKAILPIGLAFIYPRWEVSSAEPLHWLPLAALLVVIALLVAQRHRPVERALLVCLTCYIAMLLPILGFVNIFYMLFSLVADHWQYFALPAVVALLGAALLQLRQRAPAHLIHGTGALLVVVLCFLSFNQARIYESNETLFMDTVAKNPACWVAHDGLGNAAVGKGQFNEALGHYEEALRLKPDFVKAHSNIAIALGGLGRFEESASHSREALRLEPSFAEAHNNLGNALAAQGRFAEAIPHYQEAVRLDPEYRTAHQNLSRAMEDLKRQQSGAP